MRYGPPKARTNLGGALASRLIGPALLTLAACGSSTEAPPTPLSRVATITIAADSLQGDSIPLVFGDTARLTATALDAQGNPVTGVSFQWTSSDTTVTTVSPTGLVTAVGLGDAEIDVSAVAMSSSVRLGASAPMFASSSKRRIRIIAYPYLRIAPRSATVDIGGTVTFAVSYVDASGKTRADLGWPDPAALWSSANPSTATVDGLGVATGVQVGKTTITAKATRFPPRWAAPLSRSAGITVAACGGVAAVKTWTAVIAVTYTPPDTMLPDSSKLHTEQRSSAQATLSPNTVPDSATQGFWFASVSPTNPQTMTGTETIHDYVTNKTGLVISYDASGAPLGPGAIMGLIVTHDSTGCRYRLEYIEATTFQLTSGGSPPQTLMGGLGHTVIPGVALPAAVNGSWFFTTSVDLPALQIGAVEPLTGYYDPGVGAASVLVASGGMYHTAHVTYTLKSQTP